MREKLFSVTLADCDVQTFSVSGGGGQRRDRRSTGVRIVHKASGARGECREERSQWQNKKTAFRRMAESDTFKAWVRMKTGNEAKIESEVERMMYPDKIKTEVFENGEWHDA